MSTQLNGLLEDPNVCCICTYEVHGYTNGIPNYYCPKCLSTYLTDIESGALWVKALLAPEKRRRKRRNNWFKRGVLHKNGDLPLKETIYDERDYFNGSEM